MNKVQHYPYLDVLRVLSIIGVVAIHSFDPSPYSVSSLFRFAVPMYVMISGALMLSRPAEPLTVFFQKRLLRLGLPLLAWSGIFGIWSSLRESNFSWYDYWFRVTLFGQPFYLLFVLMSLYLITPWLKVLLKNSSEKSHIMFAGYALIIATASTFVENWLLAGSNILPHFSFTFFLYYLGYYVGGYVLHTIGIKKMSATLLVTGLIGAWVGIVTATTLLVNYLGNVPKAFVMYDYMSPLVILMSGCLFLLVKNRGNNRNKWITSVSRASLGIYFIHMLIIPAVNSFMTPITTLLVSFVGSFLIVIVFRKIPYLRVILGL